MKSDQLIEYNTKNILYKNHTQVMLSISLYQQSDMLWSLFLLYARVEVYQNISKPRWSPVVSTLYKALLKNNKKELLSLLHFLHNL